MTDTTILLRIVDDVTTLAHDYAMEKYLRSACDAMNQVVFSNEESQGKPFGGFPDNITGHARYIKFIMQSDKKLDAVAADFMRLISRLKNNEAGIKHLTENLKHSKSLIACDQQRAKFCIAEVYSAADRLKYPNKSN